MGLCVNCIYHSNEERDVVRKLHGTCTTIHITHLCKHPDNVSVDFVTGDEYPDSCYKFNGFQECMKFDDGKEEEPEDPIEPPETGDDTDPIEPPDTGDVTDLPASGDDTNDGDGSQKP